MTKFKTGDKVKCIKGTKDEKQVYFKEGSIYTVGWSEILPNLGTEWLNLKNEMGEDDGYAAENFELAALTDLFVYLDMLAADITGIRTIPKGNVNGPRITKNENIVYVDIDSTLMKRVSCDTPFSKLLDYYDQTWYILPQYKNIEFMKSLKTRGYHVVVHSANGWQHALKVLELLQLTKFVDEVKTKPQKYIDDQDVQDWFGPRIFFEE